MFGQCTSRVRPRARGLHQRDAEGLLGRCGGDAVLVSCRTRHGQGRHPRIGQMSHGVDHDSFAEKGWRRARNCHRNFVPEVDRQNVGSTVREAG